jgi:hypothetical protein
MFDLEPDQLIEPKKYEHMAKNLVPDYSIWENLYGRPLMDSERNEIKTRMREFFGILMLESG